MWAGIVGGLLDRVPGALLDLSFLLRALEESNAVHQHLVADTRHQHRHSHAERHQACHAQGGDQEGGGKSRETALIFYSHVRKKK